VVFNVEDITSLLQVKTKVNNEVYVRIELSDPDGAASEAVEYRITLLKVSKEDLPSGNVNIIFVDQTGNVLESKQIAN
jgi:hypothetical protein